MRSRFLLRVLLMSLAGAVPVSASPLDITDITGAWQNAVGGPLTLSDNHAEHGVDSFTFSLIGFSPDGLNFNSSYLSQELASDTTKPTRRSSSPSCHRRWSPRRSPRPCCCSDPVSPRRPPRLAGCAAGAPHAVLRRSQRQHRTETRPAGRQLARRSVRSMPRARAPAGEPDIFESCTRFRNFRHTVRRTLCRSRSRFPCHPGSRAVPFPHAGRRRTRSTFLPR